MESGDTGQDGADDETRPRNGSECPRDDHRDDDADDGDGAVLPFQISLRAFLDGGGDFLHLVIPRGGAEHLPRGNEPIEHGQ